MQQDADQIIERLRSDPAQQQEWLRQNDLKYGGLITSRTTGRRGPMGGGLRPDPGGGAHHEPLPVETPAEHRWQTRYRPNSCNAGDAAPVLGLCHARIWVGARRVRA